MKKRILSAITALLSCATQAEVLESLVVTASRTPQPRALLAQSISVLTQQDLERLGHSHISEALNRLPGTWVSRGNGQEHLTAIRSPVFTGSGSCGAFYIAEDGIPARATGFCNVNQLFDLNTEQAARIEVLRGPGTSVHGSNALHGVINSVSASPGNTDQRQLSIEAGPNDYWRLKGSLRDGNESSRWIVSANSAHDGGHKQDSGFDQQKLTARIDYDGTRFSLQSQFSASNLNQETAGYIQGFDAYKIDSQKKNNDHPQAYRDSLSLRWHARMDFRDQLGAGWQVTPYLRHTQMEFLQHFLPGTPLERNGHQSLGLQSLYLDPIDDQWTLSYGIDLEWTDAQLNQTQADTVHFSPVFPTGKHYDYQVDSQLAAGFVRIEGSLEATRLDAGLRLEHLNYDYDNRMLDDATSESGVPCLRNAVAVPCRYSRPGDRSDHFGNWSFQAGLQHRIDTTWAFSARVAHGYRAPQATELYRLQNGQTSADIKKEQLNSLEIGLRGQWSDFSLATTAFSMSKNNVIFQDSDRFNISNGRTHHSGLELSLQWQLTPTWNVGLQSSIAKHQYANSARPRGVNIGVDIKDNDMDTAPRQLHSAQLGWQYQASGHAELELTSMGRYFLEPTNQHQYSGHKLLNLRLKQKVSARTSLSVRVKNLLNTDYAERADYAFGSYRYFVGEPRSVFVEIDVQL